MKNTSAIPIVTIIVCFIAVSFSDTIADFVFRLRDLFGRKRKRKLVDAFLQKHGTVQINDWKCEFKGLPDSVESLFRNFRTIPLSFRHGTIAYLSSNFLSFTIKNKKGTFAQIGEEMEKKDNGLDKTLYFVRLTSRGMPLDVVFEVRASLLQDEDWENNPSIPKIKSVIDLIALAQKEIPDE